MHMGTKIDSRYDRKFEPSWLEIHDLGKNICTLALLDCGRKLGSTLLISGTNQTPKVVSHKRRKRNNFSKQTTNPFLFSLYLYLYLCSAIFRPIFNWTILNQFNMDRLKYDKYDFVSDKKQEKTEIKRVDYSRKQWYKEGIWNFIFENECCEMKPKRA